MDVIKQMIINLDLEKNNPDDVIHLCSAYKLFTPLIYICPRSDLNDFICPLNTM